LFSILIIWILTGVLVYLAIQRVLNLDIFEIDSVPMLVTASCGVVFNIIMYFVLHTNSCFKGVEIKHHGHSHSGDGHGHDHGHSHSNNSHGHSHGTKFRAKANSNSHSTPIVDKNRSNPSLPITDSDFAVSPGSTNTGDVTTAIVIEDCSDKPSNVTDPIEGSDESNINLRAAAIHVIGDFIQSVGVLIAALIIYFKVNKFGTFFHFLKYF